MFVIIVKDLGWFREQKLVSILESGEGVVVNYLSINGDKWEAIGDINLATIWKTRVGALKVLDKIGGGEFRFSIRKLSILEWNNHIDFKISKLEVEYFAKRDNLLRQKK